MLRIEGHCGATLSADNINSSLAIPRYRQSPATTVAWSCRSGRPETQDRHVFFRVLAPQSPITNGAVSSTVAAYLRQAGIQVRRPGAHTLRHTCVQKLIEAEFPLKTIGDYVGHRSPQSTEIYSKVAITALREVAMGNGEELCK